MKKKYQNIILGCRKGSLLISSSDLAMCIMSGYIIDSQYFLAILVLTFYTQSFKYLFDKSRNVLNIMICVQKGQEDVPKC